MRPIIELQVVIVIIFIPELNDPTSTAFQEQAELVTAVFDVIYRTKYGARFVRTIVIGFRRKNRSSRSLNRIEDVETDVELVFNEESTEPLPEATEVEETLKEAVSTNSSNIHTLNVVPTSISVTSVPRSLTNVWFATNETFISDLANSNSTAFKNRSALIASELEPFFFEDFSSVFLSMTVLSFSNGSIIHNTDLLFMSGNGTLPNSTSFYDTMLRAAQSGNLTFNIISINGTAVSSGMACSVNSVVTWTLVGGALLLQGQWLAL